MIQLNDHKIWHNTNHKSINNQNFKQLVKFEIYLLAFILINSFNFNSLVFPGEEFITNNEFSSNEKGEFRIYHGSFVG